MVGALTATRTFWNATCDGIAALVKELELFNERLAPTVGDKMAIAGARASTDGRHLELNTIRSVFSSNTDNAKKHLYFIYRRLIAHSLLTVVDSTALL
jgi:hypothetical protein